MTKQEVLRTAGASDAEDRENLVLDVELPDEKTLLSLGEKGYVTARYKAVDGAGNMTERLVKMGITESGIYQGQYRDGNAIVLRKSRFGMSILPVKRKSYRLSRHRRRKSRFFLMNCLYPSENTRNILGIA